MIEGIILAISTLTIVVLIGAPAFGQLVGRYVVRNMRVRDGAIRELMPTMPDHVENTGRPEARWEKNLQRVERRVLRDFPDGLVDGEAHQLAGRYGEDPEVVAGVLAHMREEIACRLRVTRGGRLLHTFEASDLAELRKRRRRSLPFRAVMFTVSVLANLGAAWPVLLCLFVAITTLGVIASGFSATIIGAFGLAIVVLLFGANQAIASLASWLLTPGFGEPKLGPTKLAEPSFKARQQEQSAGWKVMKGKGGKDDSGVGFVDGGGCVPDFDTGCLGAVAVLLLIGVVVAATFALYVWIRGLWRSISGAGLPPQDVSPAHWIRSSQPNDSWERFIPTNDLVLRVLRVLRRLRRHSHPRDSTIVGRVMAKAREQGGRISALDIALQEGLDPDEATAIGARLAGRAGGQILVTDSGEIDFAFPREALSDAPAEWSDDLNMEYIDYLPIQEKYTRRMAQRVDRLPVNLPGIAWNHVRGAERLAAGTVLMLLTGIVALFFGGFAAVVVDLFLPFLVLGTFGLAGALRHITSAMAKHGVRRDVRRAAFLEVRRVLESDGDMVQFESMLNQITEAIRPAWKKVDREALKREVIGVCLDLDLEPLPVKHDEEDWFSVAPLRARLSAIDEHRSTHEDVVFEFVEEEDDEVIFESELSHDRVRALV